MNEHAPGWYDHEGERRYWDGQRWTHSTSVPQIPAPGTPPHGQVPPPPPYGQPGAYGSQAPPFAGMPVARKEPALSLLASFFVPGVGQMINGDTGPGLAFLGAYLGGLVAVICLGWILIGFIGLPIAIGAWIWSMIDAYQGAVRFNQRAGYPG
ncbi:hypothetical protein O9K63_02130 [Janibacter cremeus]|uniref:hypothetical protein n=1 Tax=Janibacter cremeus TaxID=1285192 RepID=UPI0023F7A631|nr:hypothetical protein [Janibacter cremeus]WEV78618.1 hypothetical protein O9K63_02130 [Janibacter cremeus]